jgi:hypothetical protein
MKEHETAVKNRKIDALQIKPEEKDLLKNNADTKAAKDLAKKFSKELKVEEKDYRAILARNRAKISCCRAAIFARRANRPNWDS